MNSKLLLLLVLTCLAIGSVQADLLATSQFGYHLNSQKTATLYTDATNATLTVKKASTTVATIAFTKPVDAFGATTKCQGSLPCLVADFTQINSSGTYTLSAKGLSKTVVINEDIYEEGLPQLLEFFDATLQQNSDYHANYHSSYNPPFPFMADGSFILVADQASDTVIRLANAYRRNPAVLQADEYDIIAPNTPDIIEYIVLHVDYLASLQGLEIQERTDGVGFRLDTGMKINNAFVPGPTNQSTLDIFIPGASPQLLQTVPLVSLCGANDNTTTWDDCIENAALIYKCQIDEPCLNISYIENTGVVVGNDNGYGVARGWSYEFGCYNDVTLNEEMFTNSYNPCHVFDTSESKDDAARAMLSFVMAYPALYDYDPALAQSYLERAESTYDYLQSEGYTFGSNDAGTGFLGAALFILGDLTGNIDYYVDAHALRGMVSQSIVSDKVRGPEFYWAEYVAHEEQITNQGLTYKVSSTSPQEFFRGKLFYDYKDSGPTAMSKTGERVFQFDQNIGFQNSRFMLVEAVIAAKTKGFYSQPEAFMSQIADAQLAWLTGANAVQDGVALGSDLKSQNFVFGLGTGPKEYHSRLLLDTGHNTNSNGQTIGARGTSLQFYNGTDYVYLDGKFDILGVELGSLGNNYRGETQINPFVDKTFTNGKKVIPGWINGAFDTQQGSETDVIFNYLDDRDTYEYTETTDEMVATMIELLSFLDADYNDRPWHELVMSAAIPTNTTKPTNTTNTTNTTQNQTILTRNITVTYTGTTAATLRVKNGSTTLSNTELANGTNTYSIAQGNLLLAIGAVSIDMSDSNSLYTISIVNQQINSTAFSAAALGYTPLFSGIITITGNTPLDVRATGTSRLFVLPIVNATVNYSNSTPKQNITLPTNTLLIIATYAGYCGDGIANNAETCNTCSEDVGACTSSSSGSSGGSGGGGGGGGSGGGGGGGGIIQTATLTTAGTVTQLSTFGRFSFKLADGTQYSLSMVTLGDESVTLKLSGEGGQFALREGASVRKDLDGDGEVDVSVELLERTAQSASVRVRYISPPTPIRAQPTTQDEVFDASEPVVEEQPEPVAQELPQDDTNALTGAVTGERGGMSWWWLAAIIALIGVLAGFVFVKSKMETTWKE